MQLLIVAFLTFGGFFAILIVRSRRSKKRKWGKIVFSSENESLEICDKKNYFSHESLDFLPRRAGIIPEPDGQNQIRPIKEELKHSHSGAQQVSVTIQTSGGVKTSTSVPPIPPPAPSICMQRLKSKRTTKLFWKEVTLQPYPMIWDNMRPLNIDEKAILHFFERSNRGQSDTKDPQNSVRMNKEITVLDQKRSNFINIGMTKLPALNILTIEALSKHPEIMSKENIEKLFKMIPSEEEIARIREAMDSHPDLPLGNAEQFLLTLSSMNGLEALLSLWMFKLELELLEKEVEGPLIDLKSGIDSVKESPTFKSVLNTFLAVGNFLNESNIRGFHLDYLEKVVDVKDALHKHSLLYHTTFWVLKDSIDTCDLYAELGPLLKASKTNFEEVTQVLDHIRNETELARNSLQILCSKGLESLGHKKINDFHQKMSGFLDQAEVRIGNMDSLCKKVYKDYEAFLLWMGISQNNIHEYKVQRVCKIISDFATEYRSARLQVLESLSKEEKLQKTTTKYIDRTYFKSRPESKLPVQTFPNICDQLELVLASNLATSARGLRRRKSRDPFLPDGQIRERQEVKFNLKTRRARSRGRNNTFQLANSTNDLIQISYN